MLLRTLSILATLLFTINSAQAQSVDINLSEVSAQFVYSSMLGGQSTGRNELQVGYLYNDGGSSYAELGIQVVDITGTESPNLEFGIGPKIVTASFADYNVANVAVGFLVRYRFFRNGRTRVSLSGHYAPKIVSYLDSERHSEGHARVEYEVLTNAVAYIGYREVQTKLINFADNTVIDSGGHVGFNISF